MKPPAEDNYGVDACSVLVLDCTPTVLAIATSSGRVHHCVALASDDDYDSEDDISESQVKSWLMITLIYRSMFCQNRSYTISFSLCDLYGM